MENSFSIHLEFFVGTMFSDNSLSYDSADLSTDAIDKLPRKKMGKRCPCRFVRLDPLGPSDDNFLLPRRESTDCNV